MAFRGWPAEALEFFEGLQADNSKTYWQRNKTAYETAVLAPMQELLTELEPEWGPGRIFRPYRDVRFSADKSPYKTNIGAVVGDGYVQLTAEGLSAGSGMWEMAPDQLERYRQAVSEDRAGGELTMLDGLLGEMVDDHPRIELLRYKGIVAWQEWPPAAWLGTRRAKDRVARFLEASKPLNVWLRKHVGPSTLPERRR